MSNNANKEKSHIVIFQPEPSYESDQMDLRLAQRLTSTGRKSLEHRPAGGFVRVLKRDRQSGIAFIDRFSPEYHKTVSATLLPHPKEDPVHRMSLLSEGEPFKINGIHYENQLNDVVRANLNFNINAGEETSKKPPQVREYQVGEGRIRYIKYESSSAEDEEEGGEWLTAVQSENGDWSWVPSKDIERPEVDSTYLNPFSEPEVKAGTDVETNAENFAHDKTADHAQPADSNTSSATTMKKAIKAICGRILDCACIRAHQD